MKSLIDKGWVSHDIVFNGLADHPDGTRIIWKGFLYKLTSHYRSDGIRWLGLDGLHKENCNKRNTLSSNWCVACKKYAKPNRNELCICGSGKKYKKCCLNN